ncbi:MAG: NmrA family NAD(P)-binding protein [Gemmatimonadota bacterium]|nr:NmrA family NAD(P)-binding protein [Gemmatimonadota bacterium]
MNILVLGGTGTVGSAVVAALVDRGASVTVLSRSPERTAQLPSGVGAVHGDLQAPKTIRSIFKGRDAVFLLNTVSPTEAQEGLMSVIGITEADVGRVVYLSVHQADQAPHLPHFGMKLPVEAAIRKSGIPYTILRPNSFIQNDLWFKDAMLQYGVYPQPIGNVGLSRVDVRDIAEAAAIALTEDGHEGATYNLVGPAAHTGESTARGWSEALGREVAYGGDDLDAWEAQMLQYMPAALVFDFRHMYDFFQRQGLEATEDDIARQTRLLGHGPRSFEDFARETAATWS